MEVVEEDPAVVSLAEKWFECTQGERLKIYVEDGIKFIQEACASGKKGYYESICITIGEEMHATCYTILLVETAITNVIRIMFGAENIVIGVLAYSLQVITM